MAEQTTQTAQAPQEPQPTRAALKKAKKKWVGIVASKEFNQTPIGETFVFEAEKAFGKVLEVNLMSLTHDPKKQNAKVFFRVHEVKNNQAFTSLMGYEVLSTQVRRMTKKAKGKIDDSFQVMTSDNVKVQVKPLLLTRTKTRHSTLTHMQSGIRQWMADLAVKETFSRFMNEVISGAVQRDMKLVAKKFYPVTTCIVRVAKRVE